MHGNWISHHHFRLTDQVGFCFGTSSLLRDEEETPSTIKLSVIIPARNEAANLPLLLEDLKNQKLAPLEVIVLEDLALGMKIQEAKIPYKLFLGDQDVSFRMYAGGFKDLYNGLLPPLFKRFFSRLSAFFFK